MAEIDAGLALNAITTVAVVGAVVFGAVQIQQFQRKRRESAAVEIIHAFQSPDFLDAHRQVWTIRDGANAAEIRAAGPELDQSIHTVGHVYETVAVMVYHHLVSIEVVQDLMGGAMVMDWKRLRPAIEALRAEQRRSNAYEWFQWLAERLEETAPPYKKVGAYAAGLRWRP